MGIGLQKKSSKDLKRSKQSNIFIKLSFGDRIYNDGKYNFEMLEWAIKEIVEEDHKKE